VGGISPTISFTCKHKDGIKNVVANTLSRRYTLLSTLKAKEDEDFEEIIANPKDHESYTLQDGFLFKHNKLCVPKGSLRELLMR